MKFSTFTKTITIICAFLLMVLGSSNAQELSSEKKMKKVEKIKVGIKNYSQSVFKYINNHRISFGIGAGISLVGVVVAKRLWAGRLHEITPSQDFQQEDPLAKMAALLQKPELRDRSPLQLRFDDIQKSCVNPTIVVNSDGSTNYIDPQTGERLGSQS